MFWSPLIIDVMQHFSVQLPSVNRSLAVPSFICKPSHKPNTNMYSGADDEQIFSYGENAVSSGNTQQQHIMFDPLKTFNGLNDEKMNSNLRQDDYKNITPWRALTEVIAIPVVMMAFIVAVKINIFIKIILIFMIVVHIIISTCLVSYLSKNTITQPIESKPKQ